MSCVHFVFFLKVFSLYPPALIARFIYRVTIMFFFRSLLLNIIIYVIRCDGACLDDHDSKLSLNRKKPAVELQNGISVSLNTLEVFFSFSFTFIVNRYFKSFNRFFFKRYLFISKLAHASSLNDSFFLYI